MLRTHAAGRRRAAQFHTMQSSSPYSLDRASALHAPGTSISVTSAKALEAALHSEAQQRDNHRTSRASSSRNPVGFPVASTSFYSDTSSSASSHNDHHDVSSPPSAIASSVTSPPLSPARTNGDTDSVGSAEGQRDAVNNRLASEIWDGELTSGGDPQVRLTRRKSAPRQQPEAMPSNKRRGGKIQKANPNYEADEPIAKRRRLRVSLAAREHAAHQSASSPGSALAARARRASEPVACVPGMETPAKKKYVRRNVGGDCVAMGRQGPIAASKENEVDNSEDEGEAESSMTASVRPAKASKPSWKRKAFLTSGLYSADYKSNNPIKSKGVIRGRAVLPAVGKGRGMSGRRRRGPAFPEPMHFGQTLLSQQRDFRLPFPLLVQVDEVRAKLDAKRKPPPYKQIRTNKYFHRPKLAGEVPVCHCDPDSDCGDNCMNRILQFVCDPRACPCGERCTNTSLGRRPSRKIDVAYYGARGFGLRALEPVSKGGFIDEYRGEVITLAEAGRRVAEVYKDRGNFYLLDYDGAAGEVLDAGLKGNITRFANHSCAPNCYIEKWLICGTDEERSAEFQIGLFALRDIQEGEELTYDYGWSAFGPKAVAGDAARGTSDACLCGAENCSGILGGKKVSSKTVAAPVAIAPVIAPATATKRKPGRPPKIGRRGVIGKGRLSKVTLKAMAATKIVRKAAATGNRKGKKRATAKLSAQDEAAAKAKIAAKMAMMRAAKAAKAEAQQRPATVEPDLGQSTEPLYVNKRKKENKRGIRAGKGATTDLDESSKSRSSDSVQEKTHDSIWENAEAVADIEVDSIDVEFDEESDSGSEYEETDEARPPIKQMKAPQPDKSFQQTKRKKQAPQIKPAKQTNVSIQTDKPSKPVKRKEAQSSEQHEEHEPTPSQQGSGDDEGNEEKEAGKAEESEILLAAKTKGKSGRRRKGYTVEQIAIKLAARRARNAFLARVRRAKARGLDIDGPEERPLKKQSIAVTEAPKDTFIPDLPSKLMLKGMTCADARRARNAFLARVRRAKRRGYDADTALKMAARPLPEDGGADNPVIAAALEALEAAQLHERGSNNESKEGTQRGIAIQTVAEATQALAEAVHATYMTGSGNRFGTGFDNWAVMSSKSGPAPGPSRIPDGSGDGEWESFDTSMDALDVEEELGVGSSPASALAPPATASASKTCTRKASMLDPRLAAEGDHPASEVGEGGRMTLALSKNDLDSQLMGRHDNFLQSPTNSVSEATLASATAPAQSSSTSHAVNLCSSPRSLRLTPLGQDYIADRKRSAARRGSNAGGLAFARGRLSSQDGMIASSSPASPIGEPEGASSRVRVQHASTNGSTATESTDEPVPGMRKAGCARQTS